MKNLALGVGDEVEDGVGVGVGVGVDAYTDARASRQLQSSVSNWQTSACSCQPAAAHCRQALRIEQFHLSKAPQLQPFRMFPGDHLPRAEGERSSLKFFGID